MRTCDSVIQNRCIMQGRCVFGAIHIIQHAKERAILLIIRCLYANDTFPEARKSRKQCADLCKVGHRAVHRSWVRCYCKFLGFSWPVHSSLASSAKLDIVKVDNAQMVEISWEPSDHSIPAVIDQNNGNYCRWDSYTANYTHQVFVVLKIGSFLNE